MTAALETARRSKGSHDGPRCRVSGAALLVLVAVVATAGTGATRQDVDEGKSTAIKAAFLPKFVRFVQWPKSRFPNEDDPVVIGILGDDPFGAVLDDLVKDETIGGRTYRIHRIETLEGGSGGERAERLKIERMISCHILFVSRSEARRLADIVDALRQQAVLTVSDMASFARGGGIIEYTLKPDGTIGFRINREAAEEAGLRISAKLLALAEIVEPSD